MRKPILVLSIVTLIALVLTACGGRQSGPGTLQFYSSGGDIVQQGLLSKDGWQITFNHVYVTVAEIIAYQTDPPYDPVYSADIIRYEISTTLNGTYTVDLKSGESAPVFVGKVTDAKAGAFDALSLKMVPAPTGDAAGYSLVLAGKAEKEGRIVDFTIKLDWQAEFLCGDYFLSGADLKDKKGILDPGGEADLEMTFALDSLFGDGTTPATGVLNTSAFGFDALAALAEGSTLDVDTAGLQAALSADQYALFEQALIDVPHTGARLCYHIE